MNALGFLIGFTLTVAAIVAGLLVINDAFLPEEPVTPAVSACVHEDGKDSVLPCEWDGGEDGRSFRINEDHSVTFYLGEV